MSFISGIRDYIELLNSVYDSLAGDITIQTFLKQSLIFSFETLKYSLIYILSFQWLRDFIYSPILIPKISNSIFTENLFFTDPLSNVFHFLEISGINSNKFFVGFFNSFFLSLPISCAHLISIRRFFIQGTAAGIASSLGNIFGQVLFLFCVIFGVRFLLVPWFSFEPITFLTGLFLLLTIIYDMCHERVIRLVDSRNTLTLAKIFILNFCLIWTEQSCIFQYLGNLTFESNPTNLDTFTSITSFQYIFTHTQYLLGILIGSLFFTILFIILLKTCSEFLQTKLSILRSTWIIKLNFVLLTTILAFSFTSIPYYSLDYLLANPLGFVSQDRLFKNTIFSPNEVTDPFGVFGISAPNYSLDTDVAPFDRGLYLKPPIYQTFEDINYDGEYALTTRQGSVPMFSEYKQKAKKVRDALTRKDDTDPQKTEINTNSQMRDQQANREKTGTEYLDFYPNSNSKNPYISSNLKTRFERNYKDSPNLTFEDIVEGSLSDAFSQQTSILMNPELEKKIRQQYSNNPVYKFLLHIDIDNFLKRQPKEYILSPKQEQKLFKKRLILSKYHDSLRLYNKLPFVEEFQYLFNGSKSFSDRVYSQQFKGTLHVVRRLFSITNDENQVSTTNVPLKYDQIQYKNSRNLFPSLHEEVQLQEDNGKNKPFLQLMTNTPFYMGWDDELRKLVITNRMMPRSETVFLNVQPKEQNKIEFTEWPISKNKLVDQTKLISAQLLYKTKTDIQNSEYPDLAYLFEYDDPESDNSYYDSLPINVIKLANDKIDLFYPNRGGYIWPGNSSLKFSLSNLLKN